MALYGILGDVHGNFEALAAVMRELDRRAVDRLLCVGDIVGYNADSDRCAALLVERGALAIAGNHDLISIGRLGFDRCANKVVYALKRTRRRLAPETAAYLATLPAHRVIESRILLVHAGVRDVEQYVTSPRHVEENAGYLRADFPGCHVCFFGHVHTQKVYEVDGPRVADLPLEKSVALRRDRLYFINPGSVDAARKSGPAKRAEYAILDSAALQISLHSVPYDDRTAEAKAAAGGYRIGPWTDRLYTWRRRMRRLTDRMGLVSARAFGSKR